ncbi:MAG: phenylalanine--tRNA ligase subunit alpha, partial [Methanobacteriaceae archaeon]
NKLPERLLLDSLIGKGKLPMKDVFNMGIDKKETQIATGWLVRKIWAKIEEGFIVLQDEGKDAHGSLGADEALLEKLLKTESKEIPADFNDSEFKKGFDLLNNRKNLIELIKNTNHSFKLLDLGRKILEIGITIQEEATQLSHNDLKTGKWKSLKYRPYDINAEYGEVFTGKSHPLREIIDEIRNIFLNLGFSEETGPMLESAFWNFDSLFQPQDHAAREMQDTFYIKNPANSKLPNPQLVEKVAKTHETGGNTGSEGWGYKWDSKVAEQSVLRTHTTGISTRFLANNELPSKMFSVGKVFRRETITYKHLPEFHQVEGIVAGENINYKNLLGILKEFYKKLGFEVRFRPAYFPYTYLSTECEVYLEEKESWIELGGAGMFRPEVLKPLGVDVPVLAFGLGIERLAMIRYNIEDIRMLYKSDIKWLREIPVANGLKLD